VVETVELLGARVVLAGIRPGVAAGLTMLEVEAAWVRPVRTVEQAMALFGPDGLLEEPVGEDDAVSAWTPDELVVFAAATAAPPQPAMPSTGSEAGVP
jgi:hypothetical protein